MDLWKSLNGTIRMQLVSADISRMLRLLSQNDISLYCVDFADELTVRFTVSRGDLRRVRKICKKGGAELTILRRNGIFWTLAGLRKRPIAVGFFVVFLFLALFLPTRVFFVRVDGNVTIPSRKILECANTCGINFGASRKEVRSEKVKNTLLAQIPELQWAGVNTSGCVATVSVREKSPSDNVDEESGIGNIVAVCDGVIREMTVLQGNPLCKVGDAVHAGQTLISGYTDCGIYIQATQAKGEVYAQTLRTFDAVTPITALSRGKEVSRKTHYSLKIGKKIINFYKDSSISDADCVKIYEENFWTLPGGFTLPVAVISESYISCDREESVVTDAESFDWLKQYSGDYLREHILAGQIISTHQSLDLSEDLCRIHGQYACVEMIGKLRNEEKLITDGKTG